MTDRELLELAAKAAGVNVWTDIDGNYYSEGFGVSEVQWNPLQDDGDEARLEAALCLDVVWLPEQVCVWDCWELFSAHGGDKQAARRRAGVRAAAEIGKTL